MMTYCRRIMLLRQFFIRIFPHILSYILKGLYNTLAKLKMKGMIL